VLLKPVVVFMTACNFLTFEPLKCERITSHDSFLVINVYLKHAKAAWQERKDMNIR
jgi:hypothetical protein